MHCHRLALSGAAHEQRVDGLAQGQAAGANSNFERHGVSMDRLRLAIRWPKRSAFSIPHFDIRHRSGRAGFRGDADPALYPLESPIYGNREGRRAVCAADFHPHAIWINDSGNRYLLRNCVFGLLEFMPIFFGVIEQAGHAGLGRAAIAGGRCFLWTAVLLFE